MILLTKPEEVFLVLLTAAEAAAIFERHGLTGPFWSLG